MYDLIQQYFIDFEEASKITQISIGISLSILMTLISRLLISGLFLLSAIAKLYPTPLYGITKVFEEGQLIPMGFSEDFAPFFS